MSPPGPRPAECAILVGESVQFRPALTPRVGLVETPHVFPDRRARRSRNDPTPRPNVSPRLPDRRYL
jgi:hypothetical protein